MHHSLRQARYLVLNILLAPILLTGCDGKDAGTSVAIGQDAEEIAIQLRQSRIEGNIESQKAVIAPVHKEKIDFSAVEESTVPKGEVYRSHVSVSADSSLLREEHGHVVVSAEKPDLEKMVSAAGLSLSERSSLGTTLEDGDPEVARNRLDELVQKAEENLGSVPTSEERKTVPVVKSDDGEWKALLRFIIANQIEEVREDLRYSDVGEREISTLRDIQNLAPTLGITHTLTRQIVGGRIELGRDLLQNDSLERAEEVLAYAKEQAPNWEGTERFEDRVDKAREGFRYVDKVQTEVVSSTLRATRGWGMEMSGATVNIRAKAEVQNSGDVSFSRLSTNIEYHIESKYESLPDTTIRERSMYFQSEGRFGEGEILEPGDTRTIDISNGFALKKGNPDKETLKSYQIEDIEIRLIRVRPE